MLRSIRARISFLACLLMLLTSLSAVHGPAYAAGPGTIQAPFATGETWYICQGYNTPTITHDGGDEYALDLVVAATDVGSTGCFGQAPTYGNSSRDKSVKAPANGKVAWSSDGAGSMCLNLNGGGSLLFAHLLNRLGAGSNVTAGSTQIGTVAPKGQASNNGIAHIHIQAHSGTGCGGNTVPFSSAEGFRFCGNADMPNTGGVQQYQGMELSSQSCSGTGTMPGNSWFLSNYLDGRSHQIEFSYGRPGDIAVVGDWDGDGVSTPGIFRDGDWHLTNAREGGVAQVSFGYGRTGDIPLVGDWNGDGVDTVGVRRGTNWLLTNHQNDPVQQIGFSYGRSDDFPLIGDWDGDGRDTIGVRRDNYFYLSNHLDNRAHQVGFGYGRSTDLALVGDWDGNGTDTVGVRRSNDWLLTNSTTGNGGAAEIVFSYGRATDVPLVGDWDGDIRDTIGVVR